MSLEYVIDGCNIINQSRFRSAEKTAQDAREGLLSFIRTRGLSGSMRNKLTIVYDGYPGTFNMRLADEKVRIVFSKKESADTVIKRMVESCLNPKNTVVVTDDKEIVLFAKSCGAATYSVARFMQTPEERLLRERSGKRGKKDFFKPELTHSQMSEINKEFRKIWLEKP